MCWNLVYHSRLHQRQAELDLERGKSQVKHRHRRDEPMAELKFRPHGPHVLSSRIVQIY